MTTTDILRRAGAATAATVAIGATLIASAAAGPLDAERWKTRPLVVFAASADDPILARLQRDLATQRLRSGFDEREMVLYTVIGDQARRGDTSLPATQAADLRRALSVDGATAQAVLVGKDGGVKLRQAGQVDLATIFTTIDGMPMRRR